MVTGVAGLLLFGAFFVSASRKLVRPLTWHRLLRQYGLPRVMRLTAFIAVPWIEAAVALLGALVAPRSAALGGLVLLAAFTAAILRLRSLTGTERVPCGCFGDEVMRDYRQLIARNVGLAVFAVIVAVTAPRAGFINVGRALDGVVAVCVVLAALFWAAHQARVAMLGRPDGSTIG